MTDKQTPPDDIENDDFIEDELDGGVEEVDLSNIDDDFDEDDEFYGGNDQSKSKWLNIIGITCFIVAGLVGVWQFWLSGVDKYEEKNPIAPVAAVAPAPITPPTPVVTAPDLPVIPVENDIDVTDVDLPAELPDVSVEMSEDVISDAELELDAVVDNAETTIETVTEDASETAGEVVDDIVQAVEDMGQEEIAPVVNTMMPEKVMDVEEIEDFLLADTPEANVETPLEVAPEEVTLDEEALVEAVEEEVEIPAPEDVVADIEEEVASVEAVVEKSEEVVEEIIEDTSDIVEKITEDVAAALPEPKTEELEPIVSEEFVEETPTIVPEAIEYGSLTPDQILERAVVVRPRPKKLVVVKKNSSSTSSRSILVAADRSLKQGNLADALSLYNDVLNKNPSDTAALMGKALTLQKLNHKDEAIAAYKKMLAADPNNLNAMTNYLGLMQNSDPMISINQLKDLEANNPKSAAIAGTLGTLYGQMKDVSNAARYFNKAHGLDPNNAVYPYNLAILSDRMGSQNKALEHYQKTLQLVLRHGGQGVVSEQIVARRITELTSTQ